jgi:hypothetical protein
MSNLELRERNIRGLADPRSVLQAYVDHRDRLRERLRLWYMGAHAGPLTMIPGEKVEIAEPHALIEMAAICSEAGDHFLARSLYLRAREKDPAILMKIRFPGLVDAISYIDSEVADVFKTEISMLRAIDANRGMFWKTAADRTKSICVVGNSPCEIGTKNGDFIDGHDIVIRFNNYRTVGYRADYGEKTDIWARAGTHNVIWRKENIPPIPVIVLGESSIRWRRKNGYQNIIDYHLSGSPTETIGAETYFGAVSQVGFPVSSGLSTIWWIISARGGLENVSIAGFNPGEQTTGLKQYYRDTPRRSPAPHQWPYEEEVLTRWLHEFGGKRAKVVVT